MLYYWIDHTDYQFFVLRAFLLVPIFNVVYSILSAFLTVLTHYFVLKHLTKCYVNLPELSIALKQRRRNQNVSNFKRCISATCFRFVMTFPLFLASLFPIDFLQHTEGIMVYLSLHFVSSIYESCGPSFGYLSSRTVFTTRNTNRIRPCSDGNKATGNAFVINMAHRKTIASISCSIESDVKHNGEKSGSVTKKMDNKTIADLQPVEDVLGSKITSRLSQSTARRVFSEWKPKAAIIKNPLILKVPIHFSMPMPNQPLQYCEDAHTVVTSVYCKKHFQTPKNTPGLKQAQTKIYVLRKGKIQEETEENVGWLFYTKEKDHVYMKKPGALQCPKCKPAPSRLINDIKIKAGCRITSTSMVSSSQNACKKNSKILSSYDIFDDRKSDSRVTGIPSNQFVYKEFETG